MKTIKEKSEAYDEAIKRIENIKTGKCEITLMFTEDLFEYIFPELAESEDERIRKALIKYFTLSDDNADYQCCGVHYKDIVAWLEKLGENISLPKFTFDDVLALQCAMEAAKKVQKDKDLYEQLKSLHDRLDDAYWLKKQGEQNLANSAKTCKDAWSEEDEVALCDALWCCKQAASIAKDENDMGNLWCAERWLKSLKQRYTWKPSDEQMKALKEAVDEHFDIDGGALWHLYEDLKKLKE